MTCHMPHIATVARQDVTTMLCPHPHTVSIINSRLPMSMTRQDRASLNMSSIRVRSGDRLESGNSRHSLCVRTVLLRAESRLPRWCTTSRNSETTPHLHWNNPICDPIATHATTRSTRTRAEHMMTSHSLTSSSALYDCVLGRDLVTVDACLLYTSPSPRDGLLSRMPSSA